jgi:hypothetical protein
MEHLYLATLRKYPILGVLLGLVTAVSVWMIGQSGLDESRALRKQKAPALVSFREATRLQGVQWVTLSDGTWHCADAIRIERDGGIANLIFGSIADTELPITGDDATDVVVARFDGNFDCSQKPVQLSGVIGSVEIFTSRPTLSRWRRTGRRVTVLNVNASPSAAFWLEAFVVAVLLGGVLCSAYYLRLLLLPRDDMETDEPGRPPDDWRN